MPGEALLAEGRGATAAVATLSRAKFGSHGGCGSHSSPGRRAPASEPGERTGEVNEMGTLPLAPSDLGLGRDAQEEGSPRPALSRGASSISQLLSRLVSRKNEGGSRATGGPGQGVGETIPSHRQYSIVGREGVQIVMKKAKHKHPSSPSKAHRCNNVEK